MNDFVMKRIDDILTAALELRGYCKTDESIKKKPCAQTRVHYTGQFN